MESSKFKKFDIGFEQFKKKFSLMRYIISHCLLSFTQQTFKNFLIYFKHYNSKQNVCDRKRKI